VVTGLDGGAADISEKTLHDIYLKPWRAFVRKGGSGVMMSHNEINGMPMHANADYMKHLFRDTWNYTGFFHSDFGNVGWLQNSRIAGNLTHAAGLALARGGRGPDLHGRWQVTLFCLWLIEIFAERLCVITAFGEIPQAIQMGWATTEDVDRAVSVILQAKFAAGLFDGQLPEPAQRKNINPAAHRELARRVSQEGSVLLRNNGVLPLRLGERTRNIAIIGPNSGCVQTAEAAGLASPPAAEVQALGGACHATANVDCSGSDLSAVPNQTQTQCCATCMATKACADAVWASDQNICLLKSACPNPQPNKARVRLSGAPTAPVKATPWNCPAMAAMQGGYSNQERGSDASLDNYGEVVTVLDAALAAANASSGAAKLNISWAQAVEQTQMDSSRIPAAAALAASSDVVVVVLGDGGEAVGLNNGVSCGEGADRPSLDLPGAQLELLEALIETKTPVVVVSIHCFGSNSQLWPTRPKFA
jgi:hypothetical protein